MTKWTNRTLFQSVRNGTTTTTVNFTPAGNGNLLVAVCSGAVTFATPSGWILRQSAVNHSGLYVFTTIATAGQSSFTTVHNGANYPVGAIVYEFPEGSTWVSGASTPGASTDYTGPQITNLSGENLVFGVLGYSHSGILVNEVEWESPIVEDTQVTVPFDITDGYTLSSGYIENYTGTSFSPGASYYISPVERITFAIKVASTGTPVEELPGETWEKTFETGENGTNIGTTSNGGGSFTAADTGLKYSTAQAIHGVVSASTTPGTGLSTGRLTIASRPKAAVRFYIRQTNASTVDVDMYRASYTGDSNGLIVRLNGANRLRMVGAGSVFLWTSANTMPLNTWYRVEVFAVAGTSTTSGQARVAYFLGDSDIPTEDSGLISGVNTAGTTGAFVNHRVGKLSSGNYPGTLWLDDIKLQAGSHAVGLPGPVPQQVYYGFKVYNGDTWEGVTYVYTGGQWKSAEVN